MQNMIGGAGVGEGGARVGWKHKDGVKEVEAKRRSDWFSLPLNSRFQANLGVRLAPRPAKTVKTRFFQVTGWLNPNE